MGLIIKKILRGTPRHLSESGRLDGFTYLMINLPFLCNYRCTKCFNLKNDNLHVQDNVLQINEILALIAEAKRMGVRVVVLAGEGEPCLNKSARDIIEKINSLGMFSIIYSNGSTITEELINFYATHNTALVISLDSLSPDLYVKLTGVRDENTFYRVLKNIGLAKKIYKKLTEQKRGYDIVRLAINTTVSSLNKDELKKIKSFCGDDIYFICNPVAKLGNAENNWAKLIQNEKGYGEIQKLVREMSESTGPLTLDTNGLCGYSKNGIAISPSGDYMTCAYTSLTDGLLGSTTDRTLAEAYEYKRKQEQKFYHTNGSCPCLVRSPQFGEYLTTLRNTLCPRQHSPLNLNK